MGELKKREKAEQVSFLFQGMTALWPFTVREMVSQGRYPYQGLFGAEEAADRGVTDRALLAAGLAGFEDRRVTELSGGEFQRVLIARSMTQEAQVILLDEPVNNLDPKYQFMVMDLVRSLAEAGMSILLSLHDLNLARIYAHRVALIAGGSIAALGPPEEVLREDTLGAVYDIPLEYRRYFR
jgi:iron complex transport system ATP-binding protein